MSIWLKQSTAYTFRLGPFVDDTDGKTAENSLTIAYTDCLLSKNGGALAAKNDTTNLTGTGANAHYTCVLNTTDTGTLGGLRVFVHVSGALPVFKDFLVVPANIYDSIVSGSDYLYVDALEISSDSTAANNCESFFDGTGYAGGTTKLGVDVVALSGDSTAADNAEAFFDRTGYAGTGNTIPTVTTLTGHTAQTGDLYGLMTGADTELSAIPSTTGSIINKIKYVFQYFRNKRTITSTTETSYKEDASTALGTATVSDDGTTFTKGEMNT